MDILYIAYSCSPQKGSEDKIGWNVPVESAKSNNVYVVTKEEHRDTVENYLQEHHIKNIRFYYVDIPLFYKRVFKGFLYSGRLNIWHKRALKIVRNICKENHIDVIHQITPVEFRAIGDYWKIPNVKFVCGPLGGGESIPSGLRSYVKGHRAIESFRIYVNKWYRFKLKLNGALERCDYVMFTNKETKNFLGWKGNNFNGYPFNTDIVTEIGIDYNEIRERPFIHKDTRIFIAVGRMIYRKGYDFLLDALSLLPEDINYECRIIGGGMNWKGLLIVAEKIKSSKNMLFLQVRFHTIKWMKNIKMHRFSLCRV